MSGSTRATQLESSEFFQVSLDSIDSRVLAMDLYLKSRSNARPVLYRSSGIEFREQDRRRLLDQDVGFMYVPSSQYATYQSAISDRLKNHFSDGEQDRAECGRLIRKACTTMIEDVLRFPGQSESISAVAEVSRQFARWSAEDNQRFSYVFDMSEHDFYTATHMVNVGAGCGLLIRELRPDDVELQSVIVQGGLLHDVGKRHVPEAILNKEGKLDAAEWRVLKRHPFSGYQELRGHESLPDAVLEMARDHHERLDGTGYPNQLTGEQIEFAARVCAVIDVFDAITAARPYRGPTPPLDTLEIMREGRGTHFDPQILDAWCQIVEQMVGDDPDRAVPSSGEVPECSLSALAPHGPSAVVVEPADLADIASSERRQHPRYPCPLTVQACFVQQGRKYPVEPGEWIDIRIANIGGAGAQLCTAWPLTLKDVLQLKLQTRTGRVIVRQARVIYVRALGIDQWAIGVNFVDEES